MAFQFGIATPPVGLERLIDTLTTLSLTTNLKLALDAGDAASYTSGQSWLDRSGGGYDFFLGANGSVTATDPTFNGSAGRQSASEYWSFDGGDYFTYDSANETWMTALHKDSAIFSFATWIRPNLSAVSHGGLFGTIDAGGTDTGIAAFVKSGGGADDPLRIEVHNAGVSVAFVESASLILDDTWNFVSLSWNETTGDVAININGTASSQSGKTYTAPSAGAAGTTMQVGAYGAGFGAMITTSRLNCMAIWQGTALSAANLAAIFTATRGKFGV